MNSTIDWDRPLKNVSKKFLEQRNDNVCYKKTKFKNI